MKRRGCSPRETVPPPIAADADPEYASRIDADRATLEFGQALTRRLADFTGSPLFGGDRQGELDVQTERAR